MRPTLPEPALLRVWPIESAMAPHDVVRAFAADDRPFGLIGSWAGGGALVGSEPVVVPGPLDDPFDLLDVLPRVEAPAGSAVGGGWFGYLGYQLGSVVERVPQPPPRPARLPAWALAYYDHVLRLDRASGRWWFEALWTQERGAVLEDRRRLAQERLAAKGLPGSRYACGAFASSPSPAVHREAVRRCVEHTHAGEVYQANLCMRLEASFEGDPAALFSAGASALQAPYSAFLAGPWGAVASMSPELFLRRQGRLVRTSPIKGTIRRTDGEAAPERDELLASAKDRAENVMIVDLMRNDLGRVCVPGSVQVPELLRAEQHPGLWHLVSDVVGRLRDEATDAQLLRACFPPGSVTGAPKVRAMEVIHELESTGREVYTGCIGYVSPLAGLEMNVVIRTFEMRGSRVWLGVGGGIVADSTPDAELRECLVKAGPLLDVIGARIDPPAESRAHDGLVVPGSMPAARPDPRSGVFETLLVRSGAVIELDEHIRRMEDSLQAVYEAAMPAGLMGRVRGFAAILRGEHRLRVSAVPGEHGTVDVDISSEPVDREALDAIARQGVVLAPVVVAGGLGPHKWRDRGLLQAAMQADPGAEPLLVDLDGTVLEAGRANIIVALAGDVVTPPADGRILPGVTRSRVLSLASECGHRVVQRELHVEELARASEVLLTGSIRGIEPAVGCRELDAAWSAGPVYSQLAEALARSWSAAAATPRPGA